MSLLQIPNHVKLIAVTKSQSVESILAMLKRYPETFAIAESRWQVAESKLPFLPATMPKHFIGHLQTNKAKDIVEHFDMIQSVDRMKLAVAISNTAVEQSKTMPILLQVNISQDPNKGGFLPGELQDALPIVQSLPGLDLQGLMAITAIQSEMETMKDFHAMKQLQLQYNLPELSIGMSGDWHLAVQAGATMVRIGTALFNS